VLGDTGRRRSGRTERPGSALSDLSQPVVNHKEALVEVRNLKTYFPVASGLLQRTRAHVHAVDGVDLSIHRGETLGLVGESGCGKSTLGLTMLRLVEATSGQVMFNGIDLLGLSETEMRKRRRDMAMIFQDPFASLDSRQTVGEIVGEPLVIHHLVSGTKQRNQRVGELLGVVGLNSRSINRYPHEFSGGERQRIGIARALACDPEFIVCDEPIAALDVSIQAQIVNLLERLQDQLGLTYLFISHDLAIARYISDRIAVMYLGRIVELAQAEDLYSDPKHPYTGLLISAIPIPDPQIERGRSRMTITGEVPSPINPPSGCRFRTRCLRATDRCTTERPSLSQVRIGDHEAACFHPLESEPARVQPS
jgi:oligopeptide transport system ATP-binding protein